MIRDGWVIAGGATALSGVAAIIAAFGKARFGLWGAEPRAWAPPLSFLAGASALVLAVMVARRSHRLSRPPARWVAQLFTTCLYAAFFALPMLWLMFEPLGVLAVILALPYACFAATVTDYLLRRTGIL